MIRFVQSEVSNITDLSLFSSHLLFWFWFDKHDNHQTSHFLTGFILDPRGHWKSLANSRLLEKGPWTLQKILRCTNRAKIRLLRQEVRFKLPSYGFRLTWTFPASGLLSWSSSPGPCSCIWSTRCWPLRSRTSSEHWECSHKIQSAPSHSPGGESRSEVLEVSAPPRVFPRRSCKLCKPP